MKIFILLTVATLSLFFSTQVPENIKARDSNEIMASTDDCGEHPTNIDWKDITVFYDSCATYMTRRENAKGIKDFILYIKHKDIDSKLVTRNECRMIHRYYVKLKSCSLCHTTDCSYCDSLIDMLGEAKKLVREKRFSLE